MRDEQHCLAEAHQHIAQHVLHLRTRQRIERPKSLIHEQDRRFGRQRPCEADALALSSRELMRIALSEVRRVEADIRQQFMAALARIGFFCAGDLRNHRHIALHCNVREEPGFLNDVPDAAAQLDQIVVADALAVHQHIPARWLDHAVHRTQQCGLARSAASEKGSRGPFFHRERDAIQQLAALGSADAYIAKFNGWRHGFDKSRAQPLIGCAGYNLRQSMSHLIRESSCAEVGTN